MTLLYFLMLKEKVTFSAESDLQSNLKPEVSDLLYLTWLDFFKGGIQELVMNVMSSVLYAANCASLYLPAG